MLTLQNVTGISHQTVRLSLELNTSKSVPCAVSLDGEMVILNLNAELGLQIAELLLEIAER